MAIRLITGVPGAGKSYYAVKHLRDNYCYYNKDEKTWYLKDGYTIITNIDSLMVDHLNLDDILNKTNKTLGEFFTEPYQRQITKKYPKIIYFLDEAQRLFPKRCRYNEETWFYFEYHRHLGHDIYLMTQNILKVNNQITSLAEFEIRGCPRTLSVFGELKYNIKAGGEIIDRKILKKDKQVFALYKSMDNKETEKIKNPFTKWFVGFTILLVVSIYFFKNTFIGSGGRSHAQASTHNNYQNKNKQKRSDQVDQVNTKKISKINANQTNPFNYSEETKRVRIKSYYQLEKTLYVMCPVIGQFVPIHNYPYELHVQKMGRFKNIHAIIPTIDLPQPNPEPQNDGNYSGQNNSPYIHQGQQPG